MTKRGTAVLAGVVAALCLGWAGALNAAEIGSASTLDNLQTAYNGESNARVRYEAFAAKADEEGYKSVAALFRAAAKSEGVHAGKHAVAIKKLGAEPKATIEKADVKSTKENVEASTKGETDEGAVMYPAFIKQAEADKNDGAALSFKGAKATEESHTALFKKALSELDSWKAAGKMFLVCQICGYTTMDSTLQKCPICAAPRVKFDEIK